MSLENMKDPLVDNVFPEQFIEKKKQINDIAYMISTISQDLLDRMLGRLLKNPKTNVPTTHEARLAKKLYEIKDVLINQKYLLLEEQNGMGELTALLTSAVTISASIHDSVVKNALCVFEGFISTAEQERKKMRAPIQNQYAKNSEINEKLVEINGFNKLQKKINAEIKARIDEGDFTSDFMMEQYAASQEIKTKIKNAYSQVGKLQEEQKASTPQIVDITKERFETLNKVVLDYKKLFFAFFPPTEDEKKAYAAMDTHIPALNPTASPTAISPSSKKLIPSLDDLLGNIKEIEIKQTDLVAKVKENIILNLDAQNFKGALIELINNAVLVVGKEVKKEVSNHLLKFVKSNAITSAASFSKILRTASPELVKYTETLVNNVVMADEEIRKRNFFPMLKQLIGADDRQLSTAEFQDYLLYFRYGSGKLKNYKGNQYFKQQTYKQILVGLEDGGYPIDRITVEHVETLVGMLTTLRKDTGYKFDINYTEFATLYAILGGSEFELERLMENILDSRYSRGDFVRVKSCIADLVQHTREGGLVGSFIDNMHIDHSSGRYTDYSNTDVYNEEESGDNYDSGDY